MSKLKSYDVTGSAPFHGRGKRLANDQTIGAGEGDLQGAVLLGKRSCYRRAVRRSCERGPHVFGALVIGGERSAEHCACGRQRDILAPGELAERSEEHTSELQS